MLEMRSIGLGDAVSEREVQANLLICCSAALLLCSLLLCSFNSGFKSAFYTLPSVADGSEDSMELPMGPSIQRVIRKHEDWKQLRSSFHQTFRRNGLIRCP